jgi:hypothetical protein
MTQYELLKGKVDAARTEWLQSRGIGRAIRYFQFRNLHIKLQQMPLFEAAKQSTALSFDGYVRRSIV